MKKLYKMGYHPFDARLITLEYCILRETGTFYYITSVKKPGIGFKIKKVNTEYFNSAKEAEEAYAKEYLEVIRRAEGRIEKAEKKLTMLYEMRRRKE
jgi:hypothetical protein